MTTHLNTPQGAPIQSMRDLQLRASAQYGSFDTGTFKATGLGVTLGFTVGARTVLP